MQGIVEELMDKRGGKTEGRAEGQKRGSGKGMHSGVVEGNAGKYRSPQIFCWRYAVPPPTYYQEMGER